ncbi:methyltransferase [Theileria orientalis]|uniref:Methyltransferase n=1 Tax=Theileria orientalis TaxID=68886 RepID=A0A976MBQ6_THEOR|nr:methyltransferase [Theileria orientalis]
MSIRPEHLAPPEIYYGEEESRKYSTNSRIREIQSQMSERALEMLLLPEDESSLILDIGCGTGISGEVISSLNNFWVGLDISEHMLHESLLNTNGSGDMILCDIGQGFNFRPNMFDGAISISVIQWLCISNDKSHEPYQRLTTFFKWLYKCLSYNARACLQFYPENAEQLEMILSVVNKCHFNGGLVVDNPDSVKAKKYYLCIWTGIGNVQYKLPESIVDEEGEEEEGEVEILKNVNYKRNKKKQKLNYKDRVIKKKQQQRNRGFQIRPDTKYTGRRRPSAF